MPASTIRESLLAEAERLFALKGFDNVSIREIARAAHANSSMIFYYFDNKQGLYTAVIESKISVMRRRLAPEAVRLMRPEEVLSAYAETIRGLHEASPYFTQLLCREVQQPTNLLLAEALQPVRDALLQALRDGAAQGVFRRDLEPYQSLLMFVGSLNFYFCAHSVIKNIMGTQDKGAGAYVRNTLAVFLRGIKGGE